MVLPTFLICGAQKAGTTALSSALREHPDVCMSVPKETEFFNWRYRRGWPWFSTHFDHYAGETAIGEASTRTMPCTEAPERIVERIPEAKLLFVLRNPVERAHSAFWYYLTQGTLCPTEGFSGFIRNEGHPLRQEVIHYGFYDRHLERFLAQFDRPQILLIRYRDLRDQPGEQIRRVCRFIGVEEIETSPDAENVTQYPASRPLYAIAHRLWKPVDRLGANWLPGFVSQIRKYGRSLFLGTDRPRLDPSDRRYLEDIYTPTAEAVEDKFDLDVSYWINGTR